MNDQQHKTKMRIKDKWQKGSLFSCSPKTENWQAPQVIGRQVSMQEKPS